MSKCSLLVEVEMDISAKELMEILQKERDDWFPMGKGDNRISINPHYLVNSPVRGEYLFNLRGVIDPEDENETITKR
jgi:hypothetical protein